MSLPHEDAVTARTNLTRWLAEQTLTVEITQLEADARPGYVMLTATLGDGRTVTCDLDTSIPYTKPSIGKDDLWPWSWR